MSTLVFYNDNDVSIVFISVWDKNKYLSSAKSLSFCTDNERDSIKTYISNIIEVTLSLDWRQIKKIFKRKKTMVCSVGY